MAARARTAAALVGVLYLAGGSQPLGSEAIAAGGAVIHVDDDAPPGGNGSARAPFDSIADAVTRARTIDDAVVQVHPGLYETRSTVVVDFPLTLRGSNVMTSDADGWPTGTPAPGTETRLVGTATLGVAPLISVGRTDGGTLSGGATIRNLTLDLGPGTGTVLNVIRTQGFTVRDNIVTGGEFGWSSQHLNPEVVRHVQARAATSGASDAREDLVARTTDDGASTGSSRVLEGDRARPDE